MGSNTSKRCDGETPVVKQKKNLGPPSSSDPRSPTPEITRTPLQSESGPKHNITKNVDLRKSFENDSGDGKPVIHTNPILSAIIKSNLLSYDPRSPTQEFQRTPIILAPKLEELHNTPKLLKTKKLNNNGDPILSANQYDACDTPEGCRSPAIVASKNLCTEFLDLSLNDTLNETDEPLGEFSVSDKVTVKNDSLKSETEIFMYKSSQVLETNLDNMEEKYDKNQNPDTSNDNLKDETTQYDIISVESGNESTVSGTNLDVTNNSVYKILEADPRSPTVGIERTPIIVAKDKSDSSLNKNVEEMSDDSLIKVLQGKSAEMRELEHKTDDCEKLLIYEDQAASNKETPIFLKTATSNDKISRTPLSCMKNKGETSQNKSKSLSGTKDKKIYKRVSHIPRLKALSKRYSSGSSISLKAITKPMMNGDCENTPPHSHREKWDKDNSIVL